MQAHKWNKNHRKHIGGKQHIIYKSRKNYEKIKPLNVGTDQQFYAKKDSSKKHYR